jgi:hypothetical protein
MKISRGRLAAASARQRGIVHGSAALVRWVFNGALRGPVRLQMSSDGTFGQVNSRNQSSEIARRGTKRVSGFLNANRAWPKQPHAGSGNLILFDDLYLHHGLQGDA